MLIYKLQVTLVIPIITVFNKNESPEYESEKSTVFTKSLVVLCSLQ